MADFRQLALEFVLEDDAAKRNIIAQRAATELSSAPPASNPVARWVESVQPWMPGGDDDEMQNGQDSTDWTARAKALEFLSETIDFLKPDVLKPSQVKLLVAFFGAMFDVDHKAGIKPSATALSQIARMKSFQPQSARDIISKVCTLKDDFPRQVAKTRLAVYELLKQLVVDPTIASDLQHRDASSGFMNDLLQLCQNERDPDCLMVWFGILSYFLANYSPSKEMVEEVYGTFKAYFPITLPRTSQSKVQPAELKRELRRCFASNDSLAPLAFPFLLGKLDQGDGVTVNVKVDILQTIDMCLEKYTGADQSISAFVNRIWSSLKYEVRNGEVEDTINATLEVMRTLTTRLKGDELRDFCLNVTRDCVEDLSNPTYTAASGRLLVSVLSASTAAFVLIVAPAITHIKDNLRHPKSPAHSRDLHKILHIILETRLLLADIEMTDAERADFAAVDSIFRSLYTDVYGNPVKLAKDANSSYDDIKLATEAVQGIGALARQFAVTKRDAPGSAQPDAHLLLPGTTCAEICESLFDIISLPRHNQSQKAASDELVNESIKALERSIHGYPPGYLPLTARVAAAIRHSDPTASAETSLSAQRLCSILSVVGFSDMRSSQSNAMKHFLALVGTVYNELSTAMDTRPDPEFWGTLVDALLVALQYFDEACNNLLGDHVWSERLSENPWSPEFTSRYPELGSFDSDVSSPSNQVFAVPDAQKDISAIRESISRLNDDGLLIVLGVCRQLYRRATKSLSLPSGNKGLCFTYSFSGTDTPTLRYLHQLSNLASHVINKMSSKNLSCYGMATWALTLFRDEDVSLAPGGDPSRDELVDWLVLGPLSILSAGLLRNMPAAVIAQLYEIGVAQRVLVRCTSPVAESIDPAVLPSIRSILGYLANKYKLETLPETVAVLEQHLADALKQASVESNPQHQSNGVERVLTIYVVVGALVLRCTGKQTKGLLQLLREAPNSKISGYRLARGLDVIAGFGNAYYGRGGVMKPLWKQKLYFDLVQPMMTIAVGGSSDIQEPLIKTNYAIATLLMVRELPFEVYEDDSGKVVRVAISVAQNLGTGPDAKAAMDVLKQIITKAPETLQGHIRSLINVCISLFSSRSTPTRTRPDWMPEDYASGSPAADAAVQAECGKIALEIVGGLPRLFESRHVVPFAAQVQRELATACGHRVRDLRKTARLARAAWVDMK
ncbi:hypothetical protein JDV02_010794 [Purpureocillium takamizusanense]|uniref:MMS19 nucleotide excision repair protein n=1 Tax=Purpureocillium takamizusanense TaxID=2060973 RepID=A0A9Q8QSI4_9HYPO|nr:uncharacterized protein JDV02_010794 [Purpureocillium takamizusanense]UNI25090.1 hypothetical protein JDV02_010794 [Purpureocillium takamizusanense]